MAISSFFLHAIKKAGKKSLSLQLILLIMCQTFFPSVTLSACLNVKCCVTESCLFVNHNRAANEALKVSYLEQPLI